MVKVRERPRFWWKKTKASNNCWPEPRCKASRRSPVLASYMLYAHPPPWLLHSYFKALCIKVTPAVAVHEIGIAELSIFKVIPTDTGLCWENMLHQYSWTRNRSWDQKSQMNTSHGHWLLEHDSTPDSETWRNMVQWETGPLASAIIHMGSTLIQCQAETKYAEMNFQHMVTLAPENMAPRWTIPEV